LFFFHTAFVGSCDHTPHFGQPGADQPNLVVDHKVDVQVPWFSIAENDAPPGWESIHFDARAQAGVVAGLVGSGIPCWFEDGQCAQCHPYF